MYLLTAYFPDVGTPLLEKAGRMEASEPRTEAPR